MSPIGSQYTTLLKNRKASENDGVTLSLGFKTVLTLFLLPSVGNAAFDNYNSVLLGERAAGMGGAFTAMTEDPAAAPFYNPATISRMEGTSLSTSASL